MYRTKTLSKGNSRADDASDVFERAMVEKTVPSAATQPSVITVVVSDDEDQEEDVSQSRLARKRIEQETRARAGEASPTASMLRARTARADRDEVDSEVDVDEMDERIKLKHRLSALSVEESLDPAYGSKADTTRSYRTSRMIRSRTRDSIEGEVLGSSSYLTTLRQSGAAISSPVQRQLLGTAHSSTALRRSTIDTLPTSGYSYRSAADSKSTIRSRQRELATALRPFTRAVTSEDRDGGFGTSRDSFAFHLP